MAGSLTRLKKTLLALSITIGPCAFSDSLTLSPSADPHSQYKQAIDQAKRSLDMVMFHLSDPDVIQHLKMASARGIQVRIILDQNILKGKSATRYYQELISAGALVRPSSTGFSLTHQKSLVQDSGRALIGSMNLAQRGQVTRDYVIETQSSGVIQEMNTVFEADWTNATTGGQVTPALREHDLVWSPSNSRDRILDLVRQATKSIDSTVENLGDYAVVDALIAAQARGVHVRLILPSCDVNPNPLFNFPAALKLFDKGVDVRLMPFPESSTQPYMHGKMIVVDGETSFVGSENFTFNSLSKARELGIVNHDPAVAHEILQKFTDDFGVSKAPDSSAPPVCPKI